MSKILFALLFILCAYSQHIYKAESFSILKQITENRFYLAWELPIPSEGSHTFINGSFNYSNKPTIPFKQFSSNSGNKIIVIKFDRKRNVESSYIGSNKSEHGLYEELPLYWLGEQNIDASYSFTKQLIKDTRKKERLYGLLNVHEKNEETLAYYKAKYSDANRIKEKEKLVFWVGQLDYKPAVSYLDQLYSKERSEDVKEKIIFAFSLNESSDGMMRLLKIAKTDNDRDLRKKAIFWLSNMASKKIEHFFNEMIYSDEDIELKESAIFALYQREAKDDLKHIATKAKDVRLRKKAIFWLGQLNGDEHLEFLENILSKN